MSESRPAATAIPPVSAHDRAVLDAPSYQTPRRRAGQKITVVVLVASLLTAGFTRKWATDYQIAHSPSGRRTLATGVSLAGMDSYALALLLGGLRGPLVMVLWANSETQKSDRDLEGLDTQIEWIRRLQPEFDTVHVFQMWNKAYNISVQMVGLSNKYTTILDAVDYGRNVDAERPDNLNIIKEIGKTYGEKLGNSNPEKHYYRERLRRETKYREITQAQRNEPGFQRLAHEPLLDANGNLLAKTLTPRYNGKAYDGSDLQYLKPYQPFPYGLSPSALGYNYYKRAQVLMSDDKQKPIQLSTSVIDSQPGLALKAWAEEEWERATRMEIKAFGKELPPERIDQEFPTAGIKLDDKPVVPTLIPEMIYSYDIAARLTSDAIIEYERHLANPEFALKRAMYANHIDTLTAIRGLNAGDRDYLKALLTQPDTEERAKLLASAAGNYRNSIRDFGLTAIRYFTPDRYLAIALPKGVSRANIGTGGLGAITSVTDESVLNYMAAIRAQIDLGGGPNSDENADDRKEYETYIARAMIRLSSIQQAGGPPAPGAAK